MTFQDRLVDAVLCGRALLPGFIQVEPGIEAMIDAVRWDVREALDYGLDVDKVAAQLGTDPDVILNASGQRYWIRFGVSARTAQQIADALGLTLSTAILEDWIHKMAPKKLRARTFSPDHYRIDALETMISHSIAIDARIREAQLKPDELRSTIGKAWILDVNLDRGAKAVNYGWYDPAAPYLSVTGIKLWQSVGTRHNADHADYSQTLRLIRTSTRDPAKLLPNYANRYPLPARVPGVAIEDHDTERPPPPKDDRID